MEHDQEPKPGTTALSLPRIAPFPELVDLGDQVVGSDQWYEVARPTLLDGFERPGIALGAIQPWPSSEASSVAPRSVLHNPAAVAQTVSGAFHPDLQPRLVGSEYSSPIRVRFAPQSIGRYRALLNLMLSWPDGTRIQQAIRLVASSRQISDPPSLKPVQDAPRPIDAIATGEDTSSHGASSDKENALAAAANSARGRAEYLIDEQVNGLVIAQQEAQSFRAALPASPWWEVLGEIAISMGVAGVAGAVGKVLATKLAQTAVEGASKDSKLVLGLTDLIKDGLKGTAKKAIPSFPKPHASKSEKPGAAAASALSSNVQIDFFAHQRRLLAKIKLTNGDAINSSENHLRPMLATAPQAAVAAMNHLADTLNQTAENDAANVQAFASEQEWLRGIARSQLNEAGASANGALEPTSMRNAVMVRPWRKPHGVLEISVDLSRSALVKQALHGDDEIDLAEVRVGGASLAGVAQEIGDRLQSAPLATLAVPLMLVVNTGAGETYVTRNEDGTVRVFGKLPLGDQPGGRSEAQMIRTAKMLVAHVTSRSLADWNVDVTTNDVTGTGDE